MLVVKHRKIFYFISGLLMVSSLLAIGIWGFNPGIDFKGGSILEINYPSGRPDISIVNKELSALSLEQTVRPTGENGYIIRLKEVTEEERGVMMKALAPVGTAAPEVKRFDSIGPLLGAEALSKSLLSIFFVLLAIVIFITIAFRKVSEPVASWKYGLITVFALLHDVLVPAGVFAILGHYYGFEVDTLFVTALLVNTFLEHVNKIQKMLNTLNKVGGAILVVIGFLMATNYLSVIADRLFSSFAK